MINAVGIIGVGEIAAAMVEGLSRDRASRSPTIYLSPRGASRSTALAERYSRVRVMANNQQVVDASDLVIISVPPDSLDEALRDLTVAARTIVVSAVAGVDHAALHRRLGDEVTIVRAIPLPAIRYGHGITAVFPAHPTVEALFAPLGGTLATTCAHRFAALSTSTATISAQLAMLATIAQWVTDQGVDAADAERYVRGVLTGVAQTTRDLAEALPDIVAAHETRGGLNERLRRQWFNGVTQTSLLDALDTVLTDIDHPSLPHGGPACGTLTPGVGGTA